MLPDARTPKAMADHVAALAMAVHLANDFDDYRAAQVCLVLAQTFSWHDRANRTAMARELLRAAQMLDPDARLGLDA